MTVVYTYTVCHDCQVDAAPARESWTPGCGLETYPVGGESVLTRAGWTQENDGRHGVRWLCPEHSRRREATRRAREQ